MSGRFQRLGAAVAVAASVLTVAPVAAQQAKPKPGAETPPPPPVLIPSAPPVIIPAPPPVIIPAPPRPRPGPPPAAAARPSVITNPGWYTRPSPEYPALAIANGVTEGHATLQCVVNRDGRLPDCQIVGETPAGNGFGPATLAAAADARVSPRTVDGAAVGARVRFTVRFVTPVEQPVAPSGPGAMPQPPARRGDRPESLPTIVPVPTAPAPKGVFPVEWATPPVVEYPERALSRGIDAGRISLQCRVESGGTLQACVVVHEDPAGAGFGQAGLRAMTDARVSPRIAPGSLIRFTLNFATEAAPPTPGASPR